MGRIQDLAELIDRERFPDQLFSRASKFLKPMVYINQHLQLLVNVLFPNLKFYRPHRDKMHWLLQVIVGGVVVAITLYIINQMFEYIGKILESFSS
jgi:hypothetical protein